MYDFLSGEMPPRFSSMTEPGPVVQHQGLTFTQRRLSLVVFLVVNLPNPPALILSFRAQSDHYTARKYAEETPAL